MFRISLATLTTLLLLAAAPAQAYVIGTAVFDGDPVLDGSDDGITDFYIPISEGASGDFGDDGTGLSEDYCWHSYYSNCGGSLSMTLRFEPIVTGPAAVYLGFEDYDEDPYNDPPNFFESLTVSDGTQTLTYDISGNKDYQLLVFDDVEVGFPYYLNLSFTSWFEGGPYGKYVNTQERMVAILKSAPVAVPEPATLTLLGAGLLALGFAARTRRRPRRPRA